MGWTTEQGEVPSLAREIIKLIEVGKDVFGEAMPVEEYLVTTLQNEDIKKVLLGGMLACHTMERLRSIQGGKSDVR